MNHEGHCGSGDGAGSAFMADDRRLRFASCYVTSSFAYRIVQKTLLHPSIGPWMDQEEAHRMAHRIASRGPVYGRRPTADRGALHVDAGRVSLRQLPHGGMCPIFPEKTRDWGKAVIRGITFVREGRSGNLGKKRQGGP